MRANPLAALFMSGLATVAIDLRKPRTIEQRCQPIRLCCAQWRSIDRALA
jgi:hypothetical protein